MVAKLRSVSRNQTLRLAYKSLIITFLLYWVRSGGFSFGPSFIFFATFTAFYFWPTLNSNRFLPSGIAVAVIPFFSPVLPSVTEFMFVAAWGAAYFMLLGVKNLILVPRQSIYRVVHFGLVVALAAILIDRFSFGTQAVLFIALLLVFREYYLTVTEVEDERPTLIAALEAFIFIEIAWILSFLALDVLISGAFLTLFALIFHDTTTNRLTGLLTKSIIIRNGVIFGILTIAVSVLAVN